MAQATLSQFVADFGAQIERVDHAAPQNLPYRPGIGPHTEKQAVRLIADALSAIKPETYGNRTHLEVPYPKLPRSRCDLCIGSPPHWDLCVEIKMLRLMGDNGKPNDNMLMHILSPYPPHRSAVTDCRKLAESGLEARLGIVIFGYEYDGWPLSAAINAFESLAGQTVTLGERNEASFAGLIHPVHRHGRVFGWEISGIVEQPVA